jgi:hypothetical protein
VAVFFFHYNKPASQKAGKPIVSIHYKKQCILVENIVCDVKTWGHINKRQPRFVIKGFARNIDVKDGIAYIS